MNRREVLATTGAVLVGGLAGVSASTSTAAADHADAQPDHVTLSYNETLIKQYRPSLVLEGVDPRPTALHALHAESSKSDLNAVYFFAKYPYQEGSAGRSDSHLGDHEPMIVWYDSTTGNVARVDYAEYHWFRGTALPENLAFADAAEHRPVFRVDPKYHHYYLYSGDLPGSDVEISNLLESMPNWLENDLENELALSQPYDPYQMLSRSTWWRHSRSNWVDATLKAIWFNLGVSDATATSDAEEVEAW